MFVLKILVLSRRRSNNAAADAVAAGGAGTATGAAAAAAAGLDGNCGEPPMPSSRSAPGRADDQGRVPQNNRPPETHRGAAGRGAGAAARRDRRRGAARRPCANIPPTCRWRRHRGRRRALARARAQRTGPARPSPCALAVPSTHAVFPTQSRLAPATTVRHAVAACSPTSQHYRRHSPHPSATAVGGGPWRHRDGR